MAPGRGMVMEIKGKHCIVLTNDGSFLKVRLPREGTDIGREITVHRPSITSIKPLMAVASLLVAVLAWFAFQMMTPAAAAYVAIDINPSIELGVDKNDLVISARGLNKDGELLLKNINLKKEPLEEGLDKIIAQAIQCRYLSPEKDNLIVATVTQTNQPWGGKAKINVNEIYDTMRQPINACGLDAELVVGETPSKVLKEAQKLGTTPGRYLMQQEAAKKGVKINNQELRERKISELEASKNIKAAECIKNANPDAIDGKGNQPDAKLPGMNNNSQGQGNKKTGGPQKSDTNKPEKSGHINPTTALPDGKEMLIKRDLFTKQFIEQQIKQMDPKPNEHGSPPGANDDRGGTNNQEKKEINNSNQVKAKENAHGNYRKGNNDKEYDKE